MLVSYSTPGSLSGGVVAGPGTSQSKSTSTSYIPDYKEEPLNIDLSNLAKQLAGQLYTWAQGEIGQISGLAQNTLNRAGEIGSKANIAQEMGAAEAAGQNAAAVARENIARDLRSYGLSPEDGPALYMRELGRAGMITAAANAAGLGNTQRNATLARADAMRNEGINQRYAAASIANQLNQTPNSYLNTAKLQYPPLGHKTDASSSSAQYPPQSGGGGSKAPGQEKEPAIPGMNQPISVGGSRGAGGAGGGGGSGPLVIGGGGSGGGLGYDPGAGLEEGYSPTDFPYNSGEQPSYEEPFTDNSAYDPNSYSEGYPEGYTDSSYTGGDPNNEAYSSYDSGGYEEYAQGGAVDDQTTGGFVSESMSPSDGEETDDVPAQLNANEFVIPKDVALWKGQEFFQKLIEQSRKARGLAPAHPTSAGGRMQAEMGGSMPSWSQLSQSIVAPNNYQDSTPGLDTDFTSDQSGWGSYRGSNRLSSRGRDMLSRYGRNLTQGAF